MNGAINQSQLRFDGAFARHGGTQGGTHPCNERSPRGSPLRSPRCVCKCPSSGEIRDSAAVPEAGPRVRVKSGATPAFGGLSRHKPVLAPVVGCGGRSRLHRLNEEACACPAPHGSSAQRDRRPHRDRAIDDERSPAVSDSRRTFRPDPPHNVERVGQALAKLAGARVVA